MIPMHTGMITFGRNEKSEACFVISPSPGSKELSVLPYKQYNKIKQMVFTSNKSLLVLLEFPETQRLLHFHINGTLLKLLDSSEVDADKDIEYTAVSIISKHHSDGKQARIVPVLTKNGEYDEDGKPKLNLNVIQFDGPHAGKILKRIDGFGIGRDLQQAPKVAYRKNKLCFMTT